MITLRQIKNAEILIRPHILKTPLSFSPAFSKIYGSDIYLKLENLQKTGSFKIRGATYKILKNINLIKTGGVVAASAGNHAQGVALAASKAGINATIVMPRGASISKQEATVNYGGKILIYGETMKESLEKAQSLADDEKTFIHPFADPDIVAGQGTIALEILKDLPDADMIIVPVGGGGLISGIALAAKSLKPEIKIIGVQADVCRSAYDSLRLMKIIKSRPSSSIADGILISEIGKINFEIMQKYVDDIVLVKESEIAAAILVLLERKKVLAEGAGAVSLAAVMNRSIRLPKSGKTVLLISGGNVDGPILGRIISQGLMKHGRIMRLYVHLEDRPGSLARLLSLLAGLEANVLNIFHERFDKELSLYVSRVQMEVETKNTAHIRQIRKALANAGYIMD